MNAVAFHCSEDFQCIDALNGFLFLIGSGFTISLSTLTWIPISRLRLVNSRSRSSRTTNQTPTCLPF